jgi:RelE toxin of RelE / RelB toxin-antitoxin system
LENLPQSAIDAYKPLAYIPSVLVSVVETDAYLAKAAKFMSEAEREGVVTMISADPESGDVIKGTGGLRKARIPLQGRGKRGGGRVIYWFYNKGFPAVLMWAFAKNEASDLTPIQYRQLSAAASLQLNQFRSDP